MGLSDSLRLHAATTLLSAFACTSPAAAGSDLFPGPVQARVLAIIDGDTFLAEALVWPGHSVRVNIRIRGIDAPELRSRCDEEKAAAQLARDALNEMIGDSGVAIANIAAAKYYGRVLADVATEQGGGVAEAMLARALVRGYHGGKRASWCG